MVPPILRRSTMLSPKPLTVGAVPLCALLLMPSAAAAPNVKHAFVLRKANGLEKLFRDSFKDEWHRKGAYTSIDVYACRNESESFQVVVLPFVDLRNVRWRVSGIDASYVKVQPVGYVKVQKNNQRWVKFPRDQIRTGLWPDPLFSTWTTIDTLAANQTQPLWVTVTVPQDLPAGTHRFTITVEADKAAPAVADVTLHVWDFSLPDRTRLRTSYWYDDRFFRGYYREYRDIDRSTLHGRDRMWALIRPFLRLMLANRVTPVFLQWPENIIVFHYDSTSGRYRFDFSEMERRLRFVLDENRFKGNSLNVLEHHYWPGFSADVIVDRVKTRKRFEPRSDELKSLVIQYLKAWQDFLGKNGWTQHAYVGFVDEPRPDSWESVRWLYPIVKTAAPDWPALSTIGLSIQSAHQEGIRDQIDIIVPNLGYVFAQHEPFFTSLQASGKTLWGYVCGSTSCIDYQAIDHRIWNWLSWKYGLEGSLYWGVLAMWEKRPKHVNSPAMFANRPDGRWPNKDVWDPATLRFGLPGDGMLMYPSPDGQPWSSIRLETIRDGIEDYEFFWQLRHDLDRLAQRGARHQRLVQQGRRLLVLDETFIRSSADYSRDWPRYLARRRQVGDLLERTARLLETYE